MDAMLKRNQYILGIIEPTSASRHCPISSPKPRGQQLQLVTFVPAGMKGKGRARVAVSVTAVHDLANGHVVVSCPNDCLIHLATLPIGIG